MIFTVYRIYYVLLVLLSLFMFVKLRFHELCVIHILFLCGLFAFGK